MPRSALQTKPEQLQHTAPPRGVLPGLLLVALFCAGLFGTAALFDLLLPFPPVPAVKGKLDWLAQHGDEYDTLFIGSSRTFCHILPETFDRLMAESGMPTHSFNLGINGMRSPEDTCLLEKALAKRRAPLKLVVVEANAMRVHDSAADQAHGTLREVYWHDWRRFTALWRCIREMKVSGSKHLSLRLVFRKSAAMRYNIGLYLSKTLSLGRGLERLEACLGEKEQTPPDALGKRFDGYVMYDTPVREINEENWDLLRMKLKDPIRPDYNTNASQAELEEKRRLIESFGGQMVAFIPPVAGGTVFVPNPVLHRRLATLSFAHPELYPELFQRENRLDTAHLNQRGAELFTRRLVEKILVLH